MFINFRHIESVPPLSVKLTNQEVGRAVVVGGACGYANPLGKDESTEVAKEAHEKEEHGDELTDDVQVLLEVAVSVIYDN